ncbi:MAG: hypothetical protein L3J25_03980 [Flavobacteriaceae bacterium]|nr:hypothetical protein [Flavobacteriaceae bacterium]
MSKKNKIFVTCEEANHNCDKAQYNEATFWEKVKLVIHILYCRACRKHSSDNAKLSKTIAKSKVDCLKLKDKQKMKECFEKVLKQQQQQP